MSTVSFQLSNYDVIVCGGGPAGVGAAVMAGRMGARTILIERLGHLGGNGTGAGVVNWGDTPGGPVYDELVKRMTALDGVHYSFDPAKHHPPGRPRMQTEFVKAVALQMLRDASVEVLFLTFAHEAIVENGTVVGVHITNKSGRAAVRGKVIIDATADADIAASAGVPFLKGDSGDGRLQHCNFRWWLEGLDQTAWDQAALSNDEIVTRCRRAIEHGEIHPPTDLFQPEAETFPFNQRYGRLTITNWEFEKVDPTDALQVSRKLVECQIAAMEVVRFARRELPGYAGCAIRKLPDVLGTRESRRIVGKFTLRGEHVISAAKFDDGIAQACFYMDLHDSPPGHTIPHELSWQKARKPPAGDFYEIPFRCLVPQEIKGLLVAGRCISCDRDAHGSLRVMPTCMFTGSAAGAAAVVSVREKMPPDQVSGERLQGVMTGL